MVQTLGIESLLNRQPSRHLDFKVEIPCPVKNRFQAAYEAFLAEQRATTGRSYYGFVPSMCGEHVEGAGTIRDIAAATSVDQLPEVSIDNAAGAFTSPTVVERFAKAGAFQPVVDLSGVSFLDADSFTDPLGAYNVIAVNPEVMLVDRKALGDRPVPTSLTDLLDPIYADSLSIGDSHHGIGTRFLSWVYLTHGEDGLAAIDRTIATALNGPTTARTAGHTSPPPAAIYLAPWVFAARGRQARTPRARLAVRGRPVQPAAADSPLRHEPGQPAAGRLRHQRSARRSPRHQPLPVHGSRGTQRAARGRPSAVVRVGPRAVRTPGRAGRDAHRPIRPVPPRQLLLGAMRLITVAGPPSSGKTSVILKTIEHLRARELETGVVKFDCLSSSDAAEYRRHGVTAKVGLAGSLCPDHFFITNIDQAVQWGQRQGFDLLISESAGLCNRCSPHIKDVLAVCVIDNLSGIGTPDKIGPMLRFADVIVVTKGDIVSQAEREVFIAHVRRVNQLARIIAVNGITGQGSFALSRALADAGAVDSLIGSHLRFSLPSALCSYCIGQTRIDPAFQAGNLRRIRFE